MIKFNPSLPGSALFAFGLCLGVAIVILPLAHTLQNAAVASQEKYGQALAKSTSREAVEAAFRQDLISLSAIAEAAVNNPDVLQASIHSVEGKVLVQAGKGLHQLPNSLNTFQSTISLQDSVAGVVTLTLAPTRWQKTIYLPIYIAIMLICFLYLFWAVFHSKVIAFERRVDNRQALDSKPDDNNPPIEAQEEKQKENENTIQALQGTSYAALCVKNIGALQQQLNGETFRKTFNQLEQKLHDIGQLYGATQCHWEQDRYYIEFTAGSDSESLFNAACAARLMLDLAGITNRIPLDLSAQISLEKDNTMSNSMPFVGLALHEYGNAFELLNERVELLHLNEENGPRRLISKFLQPYSELLKKQTKQLTEQLEI